MKKGLFITFEGPDGSGKSSIINLLKDYYKGRDDIVFTREPGGTRISEEIRNIILSTENTEMSYKTEALLYAASRAQHVEEVVKPNLEEGKIVISDRFVLSSLAYQGGGRKLGIENVRNINDFAIEGLKPDMILFFYIDPITSLKRKSQNSNADRLELMGDNFHSRVYNTYINIIDSLKGDESLVIVDATREMMNVFEDVKKIIDSKLEE